MMLGILLRFAAQVVQSVSQQLTQQLNVVTEQAFNPMQMVVEQVTNGCWRGVGADAFVEEVSNLHMPGVGVIGDQISSFQRNLHQAADIMTQADQQANQAVRSLDDVFGKILGF
jgi:uncharacterized protein YukE